jgi:antitoxin (DNA-binding transcriptional repressor) of toxin-antitoxin stability system
MKTLGIREMRASYDVLQKELEKEGEVLLTHHGKPFARVLPLVATAAPRRLPSLRAFRARQKLQSIPSEALIREDRDSRDY